MPGPLSARRRMVLCARIQGLNPDMWTIALDDTFGCRKFDVGISSDWSTAELGDFIEKAVFEEETRRKYRPRKIRLKE